MQNKIFIWKDKSGRGGNSKISLEAIMEGEKEYSYGGDDIHVWASEADEGDEWENNAIKLICIEVNNNEDHAKAKQLIHAFMAYRDAHEKLNQLWEDWDKEGGTFSRLYPFEQSFDDLLGEVKEWTNDAVSWLSARVNKG